MKHALFLMPGIHAHHLFKEVLVLQSIGVWGKRTNGPGLFLQLLGLSLTLLMVFKSFYGDEAESNCTIEIAGF